MSRPLYPPSRPVVWWLGLVTFGALIAAAVMVAADAKADTNDVAFIQVISEHGIGYTSLAAAIGTGHLVCADLYAGMSPLSIANIISANSGLPVRDAAYFEGAAIAAYCPSLMPGVSA